MKCIFGGLGMSLIELFILAVGLSMDAFAVSVCKGLSLGKIKAKHMCIAGAWFGGFQALMPLIGYFLGSFFAGMIEQYDHWVAFALLALIGGNMIKESFGKDEEVDSAMDVKSMLLLAIATSIDALAVGVTFAFLQVQIVPAVSFIGVVTFVLSAIGVKIGSLFGTKYKSKAELVGGIVLVLIGIKILLEGIGVIG
jgi:putative Mn2+ efflux pump MntP